jgi:hypothetical protein
VAAIDDPDRLVVRVSRVPYVVFGVIWGGISLLGFAAARRAPSFLPAAVATLGVCIGWWVWLSGHALNVTGGVLTCRTLFGGRRSLPVKDIARVVAVTGYEHLRDHSKPFFRLVLEPRPGTPHGDLSIAVNVFRQEDIAQLKQVLSEHGVDVRDA